MGRSSLSPDWPDYLGADWGVLKRVRDGQRADRSGKGDLGRDWRPGLLGFIKGTAIRAVTFGGSLTGSAAMFGGAVLAATGTWAWSDRRHLTGGAGAYSGRSSVRDVRRPKLVGGRIASVTIKGTTGGPEVIRGRLRPELDRPGVGRDDDWNRGLTGGVGLPSAWITAAKTGIAAVIVRGDDRRGRRFRARRSTRPGSWAWW